MPFEQAPFGDRDLPPAFSFGDVLAEFARQSFHLFRGVTVGRGTRFLADDAFVLWCCRRLRSINTMHCAILQSSVSLDDNKLALQVMPVLSPSGADAIILRISGPQAAMPSGHRFSVVPGYLMMSASQDETREVLPLPDNFERFVTHLGRATRRNVRSGMRVVEMARYAHQFRLQPHLEMTAEVCDLVTRSVSQASVLAEFDERTRFLNVQAQPFQSLIVGPNGTVISVIRGYLMDGYAALVDQVNARDVTKIGKAGPSLLHRALLARSIIGVGGRGLIMTGGCEGTLRRYCRPLYTRTYLLLSVNPRSWWRALGYAFVSRKMFAWAVGRLFSGRQ